MNAGDRVRLLEEPLGYGTVISVLQAHGVPVGKVSVMLDDGRAVYADPTELLPLPE